MSQKVAVGEEEDGDNVAEEEEGGEDVAEEEEHAEEEEVGKDVTEASQPLPPPPPPPPGPPPVHVHVELVANEHAKTVDARPPWQKSPTSGDITLMQQVMMMHAQTTQLKVIEMQNQLQRATSDMQHERLDHRVALSQTVQDAAINTLKLEVTHSLQREQQDKFHAETNALHATLVKATTHAQFQKLRNWEKQKKQRTHTCNRLALPWETPSQPSSSSWGKQSQPSSSSRSKPQSQPSSSSWGRQSQTSSSSAWETPSQPSSSSWSKPQSQPSNSSWVQIQLSHGYPISSSNSSKPLFLQTAEAHSAAEMPRRWTQVEKDAKKAALSMLPRGLRAPRRPGSSSTQRRLAIGQDPTR